MRTVDTVSHFRPLRVGQGILKGVEQSADVMNRHTALECSFMAPGLGPLGHPDMGPYVDEVSGGYCKLAQSPSSNGSQMEFFFGYR